MKETTILQKTVILLIIVVSVAGFGLLAWYGLSRVRGIPVSIEGREKVSLKVPFMKREIDLASAASSGLWEKVPENRIDLVYQVTVLPWGRKLSGPLYVRAFHNGTDIYFYLKWQDDTEDRDLEGGRFPDAVAMMFPTGGDAQASTIMMGFMGTSNIWHWRANLDRRYWSSKEAPFKSYSDFYYPFEETEIFPVSKRAAASAVSDLVSVGVSTLTPKPVQEVQGRGFFDRGIWHVVFKRRLEARDKESDAAFETRRSIAFALWNGSNGDRGSRKSISDFVLLEVER